MMRSILLVLFSLALLFSCTSEKEVGPPADEETMLFLLRDMIIAEAYLSLLKQGKRDSMKSELKLALKNEYDSTEVNWDEIEKYLEQNQEKSLELHDQVRTEIKKLEIYF